MILNVRNRNIRVHNANNQISYNSDYIAEFTFDDEWNGKVKTARFVQNGEYFDVVLVDDRCEIPPLKTGFIRVGVFTNSMTSTYVDVYFKTSIKDGSGNPTEPPEDVYAQLLELIESGMLKGKDGLTPYVGSNNNWWIGDVDTGILARGTDGYTPVKGVDYFTEGEVQQIQNEVSEGAIGDFKAVVDSETATFNTNAETKFSGYNSNAEAKLSEYNKNDLDKTASYNTNADSKFTTYNKNAESKLALYNQNADNRVAEFNAQTEQIQTDISGLKSDKVDKDALLNAGIRNISYVPLFDGVFTVTTVNEEGYLNPHALASVTGRISNSYTYRIIVNDEVYVLPCETFVETSRFESGIATAPRYLGNLALYKSDTSGLTHDIHDVPFLIINEHFNNKNSIDVFTSIPNTVSISVERMDKEQTVLPTSLVFGDDSSPIEYIEHGVSIGINENKGEDTFTIGVFNRAIGKNSIAIGAANSPTGDYSISIGAWNTASGKYSHAEGYRNTASGKYSHAKGYRNTASGDYSYAEGYKNTASGRCSHVEGGYCITNATMSHSGGQNSVSDGSISFSHGNFVMTTQPAQFAVGYGNAPQEDSIFEVGNGLNANGEPNDNERTEPATRQNAFRVTKNGIAVAQTGLQIGNTVITEDQLKKIIALIN